MSSDSVHKVFLLVHKTHPPVCFSFDMKTNEIQFRSDMPPVLTVLNSATATAVAVASDSRVMLRNNRDGGVVCTVEATAMQSAKDLEDGLSGLFDNHKSGTLTAFAVKPPNLATTTKPAHQSFRAKLQQRHGN